jgi:hypothetical protein
MSESFRDNPIPEATADFMHGPVGHLTYRGILKTGEFKEILKGSDDGV